MGNIIKISFADAEFAIRRLLNPDKQLSIWGESLIRAYRQVSLMKFVPSIVWTQKKRYIVFGSRVFNKISSENRDLSHVILSARDPLRLNNMPSSFSFDIKSYDAICSIFRQDEGRSLVNLQCRMLKIIEKTQAKVFVANSTIDPINRLWLHVARQAGLKTICFQHGVFGKALPDYAQEEDIVDRYIALDDSQAAIVARCIDPAKIVSLGRRSHFDWVPPVCEIKVCFVGEDWERYNFFDLKLNLIECYRKLAKRFHLERNISVFYKAHPSEKLFYGIDKEIAMLPQKRLREPHVYIGFASSLLRDMSARGKLAIQISDPRFNADTFSENGYCLSFLNTPDLGDLILNTLRSQKQVPNVIEAKIDDFLN